MNILLINSTKNQLDVPLVNFFVQNEIFDFVAVLHIHPDFNSTIKINLDPDKSHRIKFFSCNGLNTTETSSLLLTILSNSKPVSYVVFVENPGLLQKEGFLDLTVSGLKKRVNDELLLKIQFFQILLHEMKLTEPVIQIYIIVPPFAQTKLITDDLERAIIFSGFHMLTTAIADEFDLYGITCNGIVANENLLDTLQWIFFEKKDKETGKLFENKQIIDW